VRARPGIVALVPGELELHLEVAQLAWVVRLCWQQCPPGRAAEYMVLPAGAVRCIAVLQVRVFVDWVNQDSCVI
jgi:hypothetical protein